MKARVEFKIPKNCLHCPCFDSEYGDCQLSDNAVPYFDSSVTYRPEWCPIQEINE